MNTEQFTYWLQGYFEISGATELGEKEAQIVKDHLALVFQKMTPNRGTTGGGISITGGGTVTSDPNLTVSQWSSTLTQYGEAHSSASVGEGGASTGETFGSAVAMNGAPVNPALRVHYSC